MENLIDPEKEIVALKPRRSKWSKRLLIELAVLGVIGLLIFLIIQPPSDFPKNGGIFTITAGESLQSVSTELAHAGFVRSPFLFGKLVTVLGGEHTLSPGDYYFSGPLLLTSIASQVATGNHNIEPIKITIPEGENVAEISTTLSAKLPNFPADTFLVSATPLEGYLFPETYFFYPRTQPAEIITEMQAMFDKKTATLLADDPTRTHTKSEIVIMASLVEREAHGADDRTTIANILWKRLALGMPLQVDASVAYAAGVSDNALKKTDFQNPSPYNTYIHKGLPPGPISNPGLDSITAALSTATTPYLFYLHDKNGTIHYAKTYAEHQKNIARYLR